MTADVPVGTGVPAEVTLGSHSGLSPGSPAGAAEVVGPPIRLSAGTVHRLEFAFVDRRARSDHRRLGSRHARWTCRRRPTGVGSRRPLQVGVRGATVRLSNLKLYRDIHYRADGPNATKSPCRLGPDEYFMLGDNSPDSHDSRGWAVPGVPERALRW